jgi:hypothetical protein
MNACDYFSQNDPHPLFAKVPLKFWGGFGFAQERSVLIFPSPVLETVGEAHLFPAADLGIYLKTHFLKVHGTGLPTKQHIAAKQLALS